MDQERTLGEGIAVSIGTAIPFEEKIFQGKTEINELWMNMYTLFRNFHGSFEDPLKLTDRIISDMFIEELKVINSLLLTAGITPVFYTTKTGKSLIKVFPDAKVKLPSTDKQKKFADLEDRVVGSLMKNNLGRGVKSFGVILDGNPRNKVHILTHHPMDLLSDYNFGLLTLLESHTGEFKLRPEWSAKLGIPKDNKRIPFSPLTLQVFGDGSKQFFSMGHGIKKELIDLASASRWSAVTHKKKMQYDLASYRGENAELFMRMLNLNLK